MRDRAGVLCGRFLAASGVSGCCRGVCGLRWRCAVRRLAPPSGRGFVGFAALCAAMARGFRPERARRFGEGPATRLGEGIRDRPASEDVRPLDRLLGRRGCVGGCHSPWCCVRFLWFPCSRCRGLSATRLGAVGRVRRARFPLSPSVEDRRSLSPRSGTSQSTSEQSAQFEDPKMSPPPWVPHVASLASTLNGLYFPAYHLVITRILRPCKPLS